MLRAFFFYWSSFLHYSFPILVFFIFHCLISSLADSKNWTSIFFDTSFFIGNFKYLHGNYGCALATEKSNSTGTLFLDELSPKVKGNQNERSNFVICFSKLWCQYLFDITIFFSFEYAKKTFVTNNCLVFQLSLFYLCCRIISWPPGSDFIEW